MWGISYFGIIIYVYMKKLDLSRQAATTMRVTAGIICQMPYFERETITISIKLLTKTVLETSSKV